MIKYITGDIFDSHTQALVNTVNTVGVMGKGIALQFKRNFPNNYAEYKEACKRKEVQVGKLFVTYDKNLYSGNKIIINFPTKTDWRKPSEYEYIEKGLDNLVEIIQEYDIKSISIPPLGSGNGGLKWEKVKRLIETKLINLDIDIIVYEPTQHIKEVMKNERVKLTDARALLLYVLFDLVKNGEYVSEFSSEKICYFLQRFNAGEFFKLTYTPCFYGPYSGKVRYVLNLLNGSYILGYSDMNKKPFAPLTLISDSYDTVVQYIEQNEKLKEIALKTIDFLDGFYSDFALELLSSVDYIASKEKSLDKELITDKLHHWNQRKKTIFSDDKYLEIAIRHLSKSNLSEYRT